MWGKREQVLLWAATYTPLILLMIFRFFLSNENFNSSNLFNNSLLEGTFFSGDMALEIYAVVITLGITVPVYKCTIRFLFAKYEEDFKEKNLGYPYSIRKIEKLKANDYSFFLLTLLLPIVSLDHSSLINLIISLLIIICVIVIYVKTDSISSSPILFFSGRKVYKGEISQGTTEEELLNPFLREEVVLIVKQDKLDLNKKFYGDSLVKGVFYLTNRDEDY